MSAPLVGCFDFAGAMKKDDEFAPDGALSQVGSDLERSRGS